MDSMGDPVVDVVWNSVATVISATGVEERAPGSDEECLAIRRSAITLMEATNSLQVPGLIAKQGEKSANQKIELEPEEIQANVPRHLRAMDGPCP